jgi:hypothetical protein
MAAAPDQAHAVEESRSGSLTHCFFTKKRRPEGSGFRILAVENGLKSARKNADLMSSDGAGRWRSMYY